LLVESGGPEQKTIIFCAKDNHADRVAKEMNNLYRDWRVANGLNPNADNHYAFKCTAASSVELDLNSRDAICALAYRTPL
jgi:type I restriction enzyme R subunit